MEKWLKELAKDMTIDSLPESYQSIALIIGLEETLQLGEFMSGTRMYFYKFDVLIREKRNERIKAEFSGFNQTELGRKYGLTEQQIRNIVRRPTFKQQNLFEDVA